MPVIVPKPPKVSVPTDTFELTVATPVPEIEKAPVVEPSAEVLPIVNAPADNVVPPE